MSAPIAVQGLIVLVACADGKLRVSPLTIKQSARVRRLVTQLHGGSMHVAKKDLILLTEADALEAFGRLTGKIPLRQKLSALFTRFRPASQRGEKVEKVVEKSTKTRVIGRAVFPNGDGIERRIPITKEE